VRAARAPGLLAVALLLPLAPAAAQEAPDWFRAWQYTARTVVLHGCSECAGEPDDVCEVRSGVQAQPLEEYARARWPAPGRVKLIRSKADPDCAVPAAGAKGMFGAQGAVELAAVRLARAPPSAALVEKLASGPAVRGWPRAPQKRKGEPSAQARPQRSALRTALVCWSAEQGWPAPASGGPDGRSALEAANPCEWWLLPVKPESGEPDLSGVAFPLAEGKRRPEAFAYGDARWARAFDRTSPLDESILLGGAGARAGAPPAPEPKQPPPPPPAPAPAPVARAAAAGPLQRCGDAARSRSATLERFEQWETQIRGPQQQSLDRAAWTLNAGAWTGHCQELDVLRAALEQQLGCALALQGQCAPPAAASAEAR
jgi:hypothetical protein